MEKMTQPKDPQEPRQFWIDMSEEHDGDLPLAFREHPQQGPLQWQSSLLHVIEYSAYQSLQSKLAEAEAENKRFRDALNGLNNECAAMLAAHGDVILRDYGKTNLECLEFRLEKARAALKSEWK